MATREDFCSFEALEGHCAPLSALSGVTTGDVAEAISSSTDLIWALTGRQFGSYTETVRPDLRSVSSSSFDLRRFPVSGIVEVKVDGVVLDPTEYWVSDGHVLNRTDGTSWPATQKLYLDDTEEETFSVTLTWGGEPPIGVQQATRRLACELLSLKFGGQSGLPDRVRSTVRQGISMEHVSAEDLLNNGRTGIFEIDLVLSTYNRDETAALPAVMSPDIGWYDHDGTTTVGVAPGGGGTGGVSAAYVLAAISAAVSGVGVLVLGAGDPVPDGYTGLYARLTTGAGGGGGGVSLGETSTTAYRGDRGKTAYDHSQVTTGNPHGTTAADVGADPAGTAAGLVDDLSGVSNQATARTNLGLGTAATAATGDFAATSHTHTGTQVTVDASGFNGNLTTSDDTVQEIAQKLDDLVVAGGSDGYSQSFMLGGM